MPYLHSLHTQTFVQQAHRETMQVTLRGRGGLMLHQLLMCIGVLCGLQ